jgi:hypothetical protein
MKKNLSAGIILLNITFLFLSNLFAQNMPRYGDLFSLLIDLQGWEADDPSGSNLSGAIGEMVTAEREYRRGEEVLYAHIVGGGPAMGMWAPFETGVILDSEDLLFRIIDFGGFAVGVTHDRKERGGSLIAQLLSGEGDQMGVVFILEYDGMEHQDALEILKSFPLRKMESAFRN